MSTQLGSGDYAVTLSEWSGRIVWQSTDAKFGSVSWSRESSETTKATMEAVLPGWVADALEPWVHLLSVYRNDALVWHGLVTRVRTTGRRAVVEAADGAVMFARRRVASNRSWDQHDATQVMRTMVEDGLGYQDVAGLVESMVTRSSRLWVTAAWTAAESMVADVVDDLVGQGLVWTVAAGRLLVGPVGAQFTTPQISDHDFEGEMTVVKDGGEVVTDALVVGKGVWGQRSAGSTPVGLHQSIEKADGLVRKEECERRAQQVVAEASRPPRRLEFPSGARLIPTAPVSMDQLVPGVRVPVASRRTGVLVGSVMQLTKVEVSADSSGEQVKVTLGEVNATDDVASLPGPAPIDMRSPYEKELAKSQHTGTGSGAPVGEGQDEVGIPPA